MLENIGTNPFVADSYCYWDVRSNTDFIITIINLLLALGIIVLVFMAYIRSKKLLRPDSLFNIYYFLFAWYICKNNLTRVQAIQSNTSSG